MREDKIDMRIGKKWIKKQVMQLEVAFVWNACIFHYNGYYFCLHLPGIMSSGKCKKRKENIMDSILGII